MHPTEINQNIPPALDDYFNLIPLPSETVKFGSTTADEVVAAINALKKNSSLHDIPTKFLKLCSAHISKHLANLFNLCLQHKKFPCDLKISKINPTY